MDIKYFSPSLVALIRAGGTAIWNNDLDILDQSISALKVEIDILPDNVGRNPGTNLSGLTTSGATLPIGATSGGITIGASGIVNQGGAQRMGQTNVATVSGLTPSENLAKTLLKSINQLFNVYYRYLIDNAFSIDPNPVRFSRAFGDWIEEYNTFLGDEPVAIINAFSNLGALVSRGVDPNSWEYKAIEELRRILLTDKVQGKTPRQNDLLWDGPRSPGGGTQTSGPASPGGGIAVVPPDPATLAIPVDNADRCLFYLETRQVQNSGTRTVTHNGRTFTINNPCDLEIKLHRNCSINLPRNIDPCGNDSSLGVDAIKAEETHVVIDWTRISSAKLTYTVEDCGDGKSKRLNYRYYFDLPEVVSNYNTLLKRYDIIVPDGQNLKGGCQIPQYTPFPSTFRQFSKVNLLDYIVARTIDPTVYASTGPNATNRNKKLKGAYAPDYFYLGTNARNPQFIQPSGDVGRVLGSIANKRFVDNFDRNFTYGAPLWLKSINDNLSVLSSVEAIIRGNSDQVSPNGSIKNWFKQNQGYTAGWDLITDISKYDSLSVDQMTYPYRDPLSPTPNNVLPYFVASGVSQSGSVSDCDTPVQPIVTDCNKPIDEVTKRVHWQLKESPTNVYRDINDGKNEYDTKTELYKALTSNNTFDGSVKVTTDKTFSVFYGNNSVLKTTQTGVDIPNVPIPGRPCYTGTSRQYVIDIKRQKKVYIDVMCTTNGIIVDYVSKTNDIAKSENTSLTSTEDFTLPSVKGPYVQNLVIGEPNGTNKGTYPNAILDTTNGKWYIWKDVYVPFYDETGERFFTTIVADDSIQFNRENNNCSATAKKQCNQSEPIPDPTNPCGCTDFIIEKCDEIYEGFTYIDGFGTSKTIETQTVPEQFEPNPEYSFLSITERVIGVVPSTRAECNPSSIRSFYPLIFGYDLLTGVKKDMIYGLFSGSQSPTCYFTSSTQPNATKAYYYDIVDCPTSCSNNPYFAISYGHHDGSGSLSIGYDASDSPSKAIYSQYRLKALEMPSTKFTFTDIKQIDALSLNPLFTDPKDIYVMNFYRENLSYRLDAGNFEINLVELSGSHYANNVHTGSNVKVNSSNKILTLIDNSGDADESKLCGNDPMASFDIVSGSISNGIYTADANTQIPVYGKVYPNLGIIVLNGGRLNDYLSFNSVTGSDIAGDNAWKLYTSISGAAALGHSLKARSVKTKTTNHYFVRVPTVDCNYTSNPTYVIHNEQEKGKLKYDCFVDNPVTYITSIGLYNDKKDLLAIAKLNKPIKKTAENDVLVKIRLNF